MAMAFVSLPLSFEVATSDQNTGLRYLEGRVLFAYSDKLSVSLPPFLPSSFFPFFLSEKDSFCNPGWP